MKKELLDYYNSELRYLREAGEKFARNNPKVAARLQLDELECQDPYVERLLEGFAFLSARIHHKFESEFPRYSQSLINAVYPQYLMPAPAMGTVTVHPDMEDEALLSGVKIPKGTVLNSAPAGRRNTRCRFTTVHDIKLFPVKIKKASYHTDDISTLSLPSNIKKVRACIRIELVSGNKDVLFSDMELNDLNFYIRGTDREVTMTLYEQIFADCSGVMLRSPDEDKIIEFIDDKLEHRLCQFGFDKEQSLYPYDARVPRGHRLIREYIDFKKKFMYFELKKLKAAIAQCKSKHLEIVFLLNKSKRVLKNLRASNFSLFTVPVINLFKRNLDRVHIKNSSSEFHVQCDRLNPWDYEIISLESVTGYDSTFSRVTKFYPFYSVDNTIKNPAYFSAFRRKTVKPDGGVTYNGKNKYKGSELYLTLSDQKSQPYSGDIIELGITALCSNRDVPSLIQFGAEDRTDFTVSKPYPIKTIESIDVLTPPKPSLYDYIGDWDVINMFSVNYFPLVNENSEAALPLLKKIIGIYCCNDLVKYDKDICEGIADLKFETVSRRVTSSVPITFARGLSVNLSLDEKAFTDSSAFLLGSVLDYFFGASIPVNSFVETKVSYLRRGEIKTFPLRAGSQQLM